MSERPRVLSLIQPTANSLHLGNYLGALRQWVPLQETHDAFYGVADLHALTVENDPAELTTKTLRAAAQLIAGGVDPDKSTVFIQSHVPEHTQLTWVLACMTGFGQASRMTQFKDKTTRLGAEAANVGLFMYPVLMAADILLYQAEQVPVGEDQRQHLELTRDLAGRFNARYGDTFTVPEPHILKSVGKIMDLTDPTSKMSKTGSPPNGIVELLDTDKINSKKIKSAVTDSDRVVVFDEEAKPGVANLLRILSAFTGETIDDLVASFDGKVYGVKIVDDMGVLYYRKSLLEKAGIQPPTTIDELISASQELTTKDQKGLFIGNDAGVTPSFGGGSLLGPILWTVGSDYLTSDNKPGFLTDDVKQSFTKMRQLFETKSILLGAPTDWWDPSSFTQGLAAMQWCGLWAMPGIQKALGDDFGVVAWPKFSTTVGKPSTFAGGWTSMISAKAKDVEAAKAFTKWLWIDNSKDQEDFNLSYGFHIPPRKSLAAKASKLQTGPAADALKIFNESAIASNTAWTAKMNSAYADAATAIVRQGGDVDSNLSKAEKTVNSELDRLFG